MKPQKLHQDNNSMSSNGRPSITVPHGRPGAPPPKPPQVKPPPPPIPVRSVSTSNLTNLAPISVPPNNTHLSVNDNISPLNNNFGSENNVAKMRGENNVNNNNNDNNNESNFSNNNGNINLSKNLNNNNNKDVAPPLPPHRTCPAPPPPNIQHNVSRVWSFSHFFSIFLQ